MMGRTHRAAWTHIPSAELAALCDADGEQLDRELRETPGAHGVCDFGELLADAGVDAVDLCVPTHLHAEMTVRALEAGKHVFCEKPMALTAADAGRMLHAADRADRLLMVGHVLRFWPEYVALKEMIDAVRYGRVCSAALRRVSGRPDWDAAGWYAEPSRSGSAALDLHVHDADVVRWWFGGPGEVVSTGSEDERGGVEYVSTHYRFDGGPAVAAEGGWLRGAVPFVMAARVVFEQATAVYDSSVSPTLRVFPAGGDPFTPGLPAADAYREELAYFTQCVESGRAPQRAVPADAQAAVALVEAELQSLRSRRAVAVGR
jgi:predicted dehydrogenase